MSELVVRDLSIEYPGSQHPALKGVSLELGGGDFLLVVGRSGSGKSTLAKAIAGVIPHVEKARLHGRVSVFGLEPRIASPYELPRVVTYVTQSPYDQMVSASVEDEVKFVLENVGCTDIEGRAEEVLKKVGLSEVKAKRAEELSGGQLQKLAIACALAINSKVVILDEPLAHLDPRSARELLRLLAELKRAKKAVVLIEHRLRDVITCYDQIEEVILLDEGRVVDRFPGAVLHRKANVLVSSGLRVPVNFEVSLLTGAELDNPADTEPLIHALKRLHMSSGPLAYAENVSGTSAVELADAWASYSGKNYVLKGVSLEVRSGEICAVMGPNASGKTTLLRAIIGLLKLKRGSVKVLGKPVRSLKDVAGLVGYVPQNPDLVLMFETVREELEARARRRGYLGRVLELAEKLKIAHVLDKNPHSLSRGQRFRVALAASLALNPRVLLLDEPTTGQDEECVTALGEVLKEFVEGGGAAVVTTHDVDFTLNYANRAVVILGGKVYAAGSAADLLSRDDVIHACHLVKPMLVEACEKLGLPPIPKGPLIERLKGVRHG